MNEKYQGKEVRVIVAQSLQALQDQLTGEKSSPVPNPLQLDFFPKVQPDLFADVTPAIALGR